MRLASLFEEPPVSEPPASAPPDGGGLDLNKITGGGGDGGSGFRGYRRFTPMHIYVIPGTGVVPLWQRKCLRELLCCCLFSFEQQWEPCQEFLEVWSLEVETNPVTKEMTFGTMIEEKGKEPVWGQKDISALRQMHSPELHVWVTKIKLPPTPWSLYPNLDLHDQTSESRVVPLDQIPLDDHWPPKLGTKIPLIPSQDKRGRLPCLNLTRVPYEYEGGWRSEAGPVVNVEGIGIQAGAFYTGIREDCGEVPA